MNVNALRQGAGRFGVELNDNQADQFRRYLDLLQLWGSRMNLSGLLGADDIITSHFVDSMALLPHLPQEPLRLVDIGSGAGFPGVVCALLRPQWHVTLVERIQKRVAFLSALKRELRLDYTILAKDADQVQEHFDVAVSRAVYAPDEWAKTGPRLVRPGGRLVAMVGAKVEVPDPQGALRLVNTSYDVGGVSHRIICWQL